MMTQISEYPLTPVLLKGISVKFCIMMGSNWSSSLQIEILSRKRLFKNLRFFGVTIKLISSSWVRDREDRQLFHQHVFADKMNV